MTTFNTTAYASLVEVTPADWDTVHDLATCDFVDMVSGFVVSQIFTKAASPDYDTFSRSAVQFDTTGYTSATASLHLDTVLRHNDTGNTHYANVYSFTPDAIDTPDTDDFLHTKWSTTKLSDDWVLTTDGGSTSHEFDLNATGLAIVNGGGKFWLGIRIVKDASDNSDWLGNAKDVYIHIDTDPASQVHLETTAGKTINGIVTTVNEVEITAFNGA